MKTSVLLTWEIPENYNPAQPFTVRESEKHLTCKCSLDNKKSGLKICEVTLFYIVYFKEYAKVYIFFKTALLRLVF